MPLCKICNHPHKLDIERQIRGSNSNRAVGREWGMAEGAVRNHINNHMELWSEAVHKDRRVKKATALAIEATVEKLEGVPRILAKWTKFDLKYDELLLEAENGPDLNESVMEAIRALENRDGMKAGEWLKIIRKELAGDRKDRRETLKEMRLLAADQIQAMSRMAEIRGDRDKPIEIRWIVA